MEAKNSGDSGEAFNPSLVLVVGSGHALYEWRGRPSCSRSGQSYASNNRVQTPGYFRVAQNAELRRISVSASAIMLPLHP
jgi:hypothetical protein